MSVDKILPAFREKDVKALLSAYATVNEKVEGLLWADPKALKDEKLRARKFALRVLESQFSNDAMGIAEYALSWAELETMSELRRRAFAATFFDPMAVLSHAEGNSPFGREGDRRKFSESVMAAVWDEENSLSSVRTLDDGSGTCFKYSDVARLEAVALSYGLKSLQARLEPVPGISFWKRGKYREFLRAAKDRLEKMREEFEGIRSKLGEGHPFSSRYASMASKMAWSPESWK